jgi:RND family efflux transporter MFP subunit
MTSALLKSLAVAALLSCAGPAMPAQRHQDFNCLIEAAQTVEVRSPVVGLLHQVHARRGDAVRRGQVLVSIENSVEQSAADTARFRAQAEGALQLARNKVAAAKEKSRRMSELHDEEFVSAQARDDAAAELRLAQAELKSAQENSELARLEHRESVQQLGRRQLHSPFDGVVVDQYLYAGALVDGGEGKKPILKIAQTHPLAVQALLPYKYFPQVKRGLEVVVAPEAPFGKEIKARIRTVDRVIDAAAGTFGVVAELDNRKQDLPAGIRCKLRVPGLD